MRVHRLQFPFLAALTLIVACTSDSTVASADESLERARKNGVVLGFSNEPPHAYMTPDGKAAGSSNEVVIAVMARIGVKDVKGVLTEFSSIIPGLKAHRFDVGQPMFITPARCVEVGFSDPIRRTEAAFLVKKGNPKRLHSYDDAAKRSDAIIAVKSGTAQQGYARQAGIPDSRVVSLPDPAAILSALRAGRIDAYAAIPPEVMGMVKGGAGEVENATPFETPPYAVGYAGTPFRKEDVALREAYNRALKEFIGTDEYWKILEGSGYGKGAHPGATMTSELCAAK